MNDLKTNFSAKIDNVYQSNQLISGGSRNENIGGVVVKRGAREWGENS